MMIFKEWLKIRESGGSFNYLCFADAEEVIKGSFDDNLMKMHTALESFQHNKAKTAAKDTWKVLQLALYLRKNDSDTMEFKTAASEMTTLMGKLKNVWHAVEWWESQDQGPEAVSQALNVY